MDNVTVRGIGRDADGFYGWTDVRRFGPDGTVREVSYDTHPALAAPTVSQAMRQLTCCGYFPSKAMLPTEQCADWFADVDCDVWLVTCA